LIYGIRKEDEIKSTSRRTDLGQVCLNKITKVAGIASYFKIFVILDRAKMAWSCDA